MRGKQVLITGVAVVVGAVGALGIEHLIYQGNSDRAVPKPIDPISKPVESTPEPIVPISKDTIISDSTQNPINSQAPLSSLGDYNESTPIENPGLLLSNLDIVTGEVSYFNSAIRTLSSERNMQNAQVVDRTGATCFLSMYDATYNRPNFYRQIMWATHFFDDANTCIGIYRKMGDNSDMQTLIDKMQTRREIGRDLVLNGHSKELGEKVEKIRLEYTGR